MAMEGAGESALDVLSRAATMLQEQSPIRMTNDEPKPTINSKQLPTTKWKRDRRSRTEYTRKLHTDNGRESPTSTRLDAAQPNCQDDSTDSKTITALNGDAPLDMSVRHRGLPPSYNQAISDPSFRSNYRTAVKTTACETDTLLQTTVTYTSNGSTNVGNAHSARDEVPSGISMCDPIIDEHFRRSLGKAYMTVFNTNQQATVNVKDGRQKSSSPTASSAQIAVASAAAAAAAAKTKVSTNSDDRSAGVNRQVTGGSVSADLMDGGGGGGGGAGLSVDDHFAKALGDTWLKLNGNKKGADNSSDKVGSVKAPSVVENGNSNSMVTI